MIKGVVSYFESVYPTALEMETCPHINLTSDAVWDPNGSFMEAREHQLTSRIHAVSVNGDDIWETMSLTDLDTKAISELDNDIVIEEIATDSDILLVLNTHTTQSYSSQTLQN